MRSQMSNKSMIHHSQSKLLPFVLRQPPRPVELQRESWTRTAPAFFAGDSPAVLVSNGLVDCPTRWSLGSWYLDFFVDHLYFDDLRNVVQQCFISSCLKAVTHTADTQQLVSSRWLPMQTSLHLVSFPNLYFVEPHQALTRVSLSREKSRVEREISLSISKIW